MGHTPHERSFSKIVRSVKKTIAFKKFFYEKFDSSVKKISFFKVCSLVKKKVFFISLKDPSCSSIARYLQDNIVYEKLSSFSKISSFTKTMPIFR